MGDLAAPRTLSFRSPRSTRQRTLRERRRYFLQRRNTRWQTDAGTVHLVEHHPDVCALGTGLFARRREDVGNELDHGISTRAVSRNSERSSRGSLLVVEDQLRTYEHKRELTESTTKRTTLCQLAPQTRSDFTACSVPRLRKSIARSLMRTRWPNGCHQMDSRERFTRWTQRSVAPTRCRL